MCEYCEHLDIEDCGSDIIKDGDYTDSFHLWKDIKGLYRIECYADHSAPINFCPMCGRNLKEEK